MVQKIVEFFQTIIQFFGGIINWYLSIDLPSQIIIGFFAFCAIILIKETIDIIVDGGGISIRF